MALLSIVYVSSASELLLPEHLLALLQTSRRNNTRDSVSGMLLYKSGNFMQAIEGEEETIHRLHDKIQRDPRHHGLITLIEQPVPHRRFGEWSMGFQNLADPELRATPGFTEFLSVSLDGKQMSTDPSLAMRLLETFRKKM